MKSIIKKFISILIIVALTYFISYRITMHNIIPKVENGHFVKLTVYGITDEYYAE